MEVHFSTGIMTNKYINTIINMAIYLVKNLKFTCGKACSFSCQPAHLTVTCCMYEKESKRAFKNIETNGRLKRKTRENMEKKVQIV